MIGKPLIPLCLWIARCKQKAIDRGDCYIDMFDKKSWRMARNWEYAATYRKNCGLQHPIYGHMNKHLLKMKYKLKGYKLKDEYSL